jgi:hypothetical protein
MRITINTYQSAAIKKCRNTTSWETEIDVTTLTEEQRQKLISVSSANLIDLTDSRGELTAESIQTVIEVEREREAEKEAREEAKKLELIEKYSALVEKYERGGELNFSIGDWLDSCLNPLRERIAAETERRVNAWEEKIAPEVAAYLAGGPRDFPSWQGKWEGKQETFELIQSESAKRKEIERKCRQLAEEAEDEEKLNQLTDVVNRIGSDLQREKWAAGLMAREEVIEMMRNEVFPDGYLPADEYHLEKIEGTTRCETKKETLTDEQFAKAKEIINLIQGVTATYHHEYYGDNDNYPETFDIMRIRKVVGKYTLEADYIL